MTPQEIEALFTRADGTFLCARWGRPIAPIVFGTDEASLRTLKGAVEAVVTLAGHTMAETDPELGANLMLFFFRDWDELTAVPDLDRLVPDLGPLVARLAHENANQYRLFRFDAAGAIRACFVFIRLDDALAALPADTLALGQIVQTILLWSDSAFTATSPLSRLPGGGGAGKGSSGKGGAGKVILKPEIAGLIRAAYDPVLPAMSRDPSHALRLAARMQPRPAPGAPVASDGTSDPAAEG